ncbi:hypothetical protein M3650_26925 [Paenibacillus sp. MER TA 81-3]|uniref:hypothetical protein n=1 Tax=Paenibacillus sp. MER TA 81-3 TaxID=2939573 RepID=UPI00204261EE|nr:hypothetical protein [Paenibacillus sp. MER TA 81-3]MCM3342155.1 hypothetical protein [Paenibacillus sp. MER TA 81-3]
MIDDASRIVVQSQSDLADVTALMKGLPKLEEMDADYISGAGEINDILVQLSVQRIHSLSLRDEPTAFGTEAAAIANQSAFPL